jgi:hypothetical protein
VISRFYWCDLQHTTISPAQTVHHIRFNFIKYIFLGYIYRLRLRINNGGSAFGHRRRPSGLRCLRLWVVVGICGRKWGGLLCKRRGLTLSNRRSKQPTSRRVASWRQQKGKRKPPPQVATGAALIGSSLARRCRDTVALCAKACNRSSLLDRNRSLSKALWLFLFPT